MLLRRIIEHVKAQNWFAVGLDFVIVVAGVFIGLQVQQWNEARKDAVQHAKLLERLEEEFRDLEPVAAELVAFLHSSRQSTSDVVNALRQEQPPADEAAFRFALGRANWVMNFPDIATALSASIPGRPASSLRRTRTTIGPSTGTWTRTPGKPTGRYSPMTGRCSGPRARRCRAGCRSSTTWSCTPRGSSNRSGRFLRSSRKTRDDAVDLPACP
jgi:hypothetical protein